MASGIQTKLALAATTYTTIAAGPASGYAQALSVSLCNRGSAASVRLAIVNSGTTTPSSTDWLEYDSTINANSVLERTGIILNNGQTLVAYASTANFSCVTYGLDDVVPNANSGVQGKIALSATTNTTITSGPASGRMRTVTVNFCNSSSTARTVRLYVSTTPTSPAAGDYLEYDFSLAAYGVLERTGIVLDAGMGVGAYASGAGINVVCYGVDGEA